MIGTKDAAKILKRSEAMTRRLLADGKTFKTAQQPNRNWVAERWEVVDYAEKHPPRNYRKP